MADATPSAVPDEHVVNPPLSTWQTIVSMDFMIIELQMILSAILIIWVGAHASLRRPPSAAPPTKKRKRGGKHGKDAALDEDESFVGGFEAMDAIKFPLVAGTLLIGLYYLIKWLQDPAILNKILRLYMAITGFASTGIFIGDALQFLLGFLYPEYWADSNGRLFKIDYRNRSQKLFNAEHDKNADPSINKQVDSKKRTPFPGAASELAVSSSTSRCLYTIRHFLIEDWTLELSILGLGKDTTSFKVTSLIGLLLGIAIQSTYLYSSLNVLANIIGLAVCYMAFQYVSVTSFFIGTLVLSGLFIYDIVMVFYTPFMVAVATQLDAPIKLTYETAKRSSILGLGDIVVPGIFICLALRFDLWKHYQRKITREKTELETVTKKDKSGDDSNGASNREVTTVQTAYREVKAPFVDPRGQWGNYFWTSSFRSLIFGEPSLSSLKEASFSKTYFRATIFGYLLGMLATIAVLLVTKHGQPALLYLVPGVVGTAYLTGWLRGELGDMWYYTEDGSLDVTDVVVDVDGEGNVIQKPKEKADEKDLSSKALDKKEGGGEKEEEEDSHAVFSFAITVPKEDSPKED